MTNRQALITPWAAGGEVIDPNLDTTHPIFQAGKYDLGWLQEKFPHEWQNFYYNKHDLSELDVMKNSNWWQSAINYKVGSVVYSGVGDLDTSKIANVGDILITSSTELLDYYDVVVAQLLLCDGATFNQVTYPELYTLLGSNVLPNIPTTTGSPSPYKIVANYDAPVVDENAPKQMHVATQASIGKIPLVSPTVWTPNPIFGMTNTEVAGSISTATQQLSVHLSTVNPHEDNASAVETYEEEEVLSNGYWTELGTHVSDSEAHLETYDQLGMLDAAIGGQFTGSVELKKGILGANAVELSSTIFKMDAITNSISLVKDADPRVGISSILHTGDAVRIRGAKSGRFIIPTPDIHIPLVSGVNVYTSLNSKILGDLTYERPTNVAYTNKSGVLSTAVQDEPPISKLGLKKTVDSILRLNVPITNTAPSGSVSAWIDGTTVVLTEVNIEETTNILALFEGEYIRDIRIWNQILTLEQIRALGEAAIIPLFGTFAAVGDIIITGSTVLYDSRDVATDDLLLCDGTTYDELVYPELFLLLGTNVLPNIPTATGSPYPYKIVADYTGG